MKLLETT